MSTATSASRGAFGDVPGAAYPVALRAEVEAYLRGLRFSRDAACSGLADAMRYSLLTGGKRVRPVLTLSTARVLDLDHRRMLPLAAGIELIHTFSLIHDDLPAMDDDDLRRGKPTNHRVFGEGVAVLAGDALLAEAFRLLLRLDGTPELAHRAARVVADAVATDGLAGGQYIDLVGSAAGEAAVLHMHRLKTGRLLEASVRSVLELDPPDDATAEALSDFAAELGLMFQIVDDILALVGTDATTGKSGNSDQRNLRRTLVADGREERALQLADDCCSRIAEALARVPADTGELIGIAQFVRGRVA